MRIGTYNVLGLRGYPHEESSPDIGKPGDESNTTHFVRVFSELNCDILALQEGVSIRTAQHIAFQMGYYLASIPSPINWPGHILSKYSILESRVFSHLDPKQETPPFSRTSGAALLSVEDSTFWVVNVHLHPSNVDLRRQEANLLQHCINQLKHTSDDIVVLGDFNSEVDEYVHKYLVDMQFVNAMESVGGGIQATMDTVGIQTHYIDHIYVSQSLAPQLHTAEVIRRSGFRHNGPQEKGVWVHSDHLPVIAELH